MPEMTERSSRTARGSLDAAAAYGGAAMSSLFAFAKAGVRSVGAFMDAGIQTVAAFDAAHRTGRGASADDPPG